MAKQKEAAEKDPESAADIVWQARVGQGVDEWLAAKLSRYCRDRGRAVSRSEYLRYLLEEMMLDERRRQKAAL